MIVSSAQSSHSEVQPCLGQDDFRKDSPSCRTETERHLGDVNTKKRPFPRKDNVSLFQKSASLSSVCVTENTLRNNVFVGNLSKSYSSIQEHRRRVHPHEAHSPQFTKRRYHSLCASVPSVSGAHLGMMDVR